MCLANKIQIVHVIIVFVYDMATAVAEVSQQRCLTTLPFVFITLRSKPYHHLSRTHFLNVMFNLYI